MGSNLRNNFNELLDAFNFSEVYLIMDTLDIDWGNGTPRISKMKEHCIELFNEASKDFDKDGKKISLMSGNFEVEISENKSITLRFVPTETIFDADTGDIY